MGATSTQPSHGLPVVMQRRRGQGPHSEAMQQFASASTGAQGTIHPHICLHPCPYRTVALHEFGHAFVALCPSLGVPKWLLGVHVFLLIFHAQIVRKSRL